MDWESSTLTTKLLLQWIEDLQKIDGLQKIKQNLIKRDFDSFLLWELQKSAC